MTVVKYTTGWKDACAVFFYFLITIIIHAVLQEYIFDVSILCQYPDYKILTDCKNIFKLSLMKIIFLRRKFPSDFISAK